MDLLSKAWVPVRRKNGPAVGSLVTLEELLCGEEEWEIALPRDDLEMACLQLLISLTQVMFPPEDNADLRSRAKSPLAPKEFADGVGKLGDWFDLDHPKWPFMQTRSTKADKVTGIQKLLLGLPEGSNHCFFNEAHEVQQIGAPLAAIALFHQGANSPSFGGGPGGGFKASLRGNAPITTLVSGNDLRGTIWRNILTREYLYDRRDGYSFDFSKDRPTWVEPIERDKTIYVKDIGLLRGLFWQPARIELLKDASKHICDVLGGESGTVYSGFFKEPFGYKVDGFWSHPHGVATFETKKGKREEKYLSFTTTAPAWTQMTEFVMPLGDKNKDKSGCEPAWPITQFGKVWYRQPLHLKVGGYRVENGAALRERRHELFSLASGWSQAGDNLKHLVDLALKSRDALRKKLFYAGKGNKDKGFKGLGVGLQQTGEALFFRRTERLVQSALAEVAFDDAQFNAHREGFVNALAAICQDIFNELTSTYAAKPELVPIIAVARAGLGTELAKLQQEVQTHGG